MTQEDKTNLLPLWFERNWPLKNGQHVNTQMPCVTATKFCETLKAHGIQASMRKDYHFGNHERSYYEVTLTANDVQTILGSPPIQQAITSSLSQYGEQSNLHYLDRLFNGGDWRYDSGQENYYPAAPLPNAARVTNELKECFPNDIIPLGQGEYCSAHIPASVLLKLYEDPNKARRIQTVASRAEPGADRAI